MLDQESNHIGYYTPVCSDGAVISHVKQEFDSTPRENIEQVDFFFKSLVYSKIYVK